MADNKGDVYFRNGACLVDTLFHSTHLVPMYGKFFMNFFEISHRKHTLAIQLTKKLELNRRARG